MPNLNTKLVLRKIVEVHQKLRYITTVEEAVRILLPALVEAVGFEGIMLKVRDEDGLFRGFVLSMDGSINATAQTTDTVGYEHFMKKAKRVSNSYFASHDLHVWDSLPNAHFSTFYEDPDWQPGQWHPEDALMIPVFDQDDELVGVLWPDRPTDGRIPDERVVQIIEVFAAQVVAATEIRRLLERSQETSITDGLTRLHTHRYFQECLEQEVAEAQRHHDTLTLLMLDLDHFKRINDRYGHPVGDQVLRQTAEALRSITRESDYIARYGGEEFAMILPRTSKEGALVQAERLRTTVNGSWSEDLPGVTVSVGVATFPSDADSKDTLIIAADTALLKAKRTGRDRVCVYDRLLNVSNA